MLSRAGQYGIEGISRLFGVKSAPSEQNRQRHQWGIGGDALLALSPGALS